MEPGTVLNDRFEIQRRSGAGAMGEVFQASDRISGEQVAVKVRLYESPTAAARFSRESRILAELSHPGIVRYIDHGATKSGQSYLVMEWLEGEDLSSRLERGGLTLAESIELATRVASALAAAHARGVIHRDIKPSNLFLIGNRVDQVKLLDFGLARFDEATIMTQEGVIMGTPSYMAPEQARGALQLDGRVDIFALGCVVFECLTGKRAFFGHQIMATLAKVLYAEVPSVREFQPAIPQEIADLVAWMLAKSPDQRPRDGAELFNALAALGPTPTLTLTMPRSFRRPANALTDSERRSIGVILIGAGGSASESRKAFADATFVHEVENVGAIIQPMLDGSALVTMSEAGTATDLAAKSASLALLIRRYVGNRPIALSMSRSDDEGRTQPTCAIDSAASLLDEEGSTMLPISSEAETSEGFRPAQAPIRLDSVTAGLLDARFDVRDKGSGFLLYGERPVAEGARTLLGKPTACVGRDRELGLLEQLFEECVDERAPQAVLITGQAGMGKSRLAHEFLREVRRRSENVTLWIGRADSLRAGSTFGLLGQALRGVCGLLDGDALEQRRAHLRARVALHVAASEQQRVSEFIGEISGTPMPDEDSVALRAARADAQLMGDQMRMAWEDFVAAECSAGPVILVLEDLHWGDSATVRFVDLALRRRDLPLMVMAMARPEVHELFPKLWTERALQEIRLRELSARAAERLVRQVLGTGVSAERVDRMVALADGNAFHLEELIRATAEREDEQLPETVVAMVQSRLAAFNAGCRRILRAASCFGESAWLGGIMMLLGDEGSDELARAGIAELIEREVLVKRPKSRFAGHHEFAFRHALLREGAYAMLTEDDRKLGHRLAGQWLEQHGESEPLVLAEHFERGGQPERAGTHYLHAAQMILASGDGDATRALVLKGLACGALGETRISLLGTYCDASSWQAGAVAGAVPYAEEVLRIAAPGSVAWAQAVTILLFSHLHTGNVAGVMAALEQLASDVPVTAESVGPICAGLVAGTYFLDAVGQLERAAHLMQRAVAIEEHGSARAGLGIEGILDGVTREDPFRGLYRAQQTIAYVRQLNHRRALALMHVVAGCLSWLLGAFAEAERAFDSVVVADSELGLIASLRPFVRVMLLGHRGARDEAIVIAQRLIERATIEHDFLSMARGRWALAHALLCKEEFAAAEREIQTALQLMGFFRLDHIGASATFAAIQLAAGRAEDALATAEDAMARYRTIGACGFMRGPYLRVVHIETLLATGREHEARNAIAIAHEKLLILADRIEDPGYRKSFLEAVPENVRTLELAKQAEQV
jgi:serine/threonine protein kinase/tetratricopeptide (TPR) repeat protein